MTVMKSRIEWVVLLEMERKETVVAVEMGGRGKGGDGGEDKLNSRG